MVAVSACGTDGTAGAGGTEPPTTTWTRFTDELAKAEEVVDDLIPDPVRETGILPVAEGDVYERTPQDDRNRAEGFRQLTRLLRLGLWSIGEHGFGQMGDEHSQVFLRTDPTNSTGATTSNALYFGMFPNGTDAYRISGVLRFYFGDDRVRMAGGIADFDTTRDVEGDTLWITTADGGRKAMTIGADGSLTGEFGVFTKKK